MSTSTTAVDAIVTLLETNSGYEINLFGLLQLVQLEDLSFAINSFQFDPVACKLRLEQERLFYDAREAALAFEQERLIRQLGYEFEREEREQGED